MATISLATIVSRMNDLKYPFIPMLESAAPLVDEIVVNVDRGRDDGTYRKIVEFLRGVAAYTGGIRVIQHDWDWCNREGGSELAIQSNAAVGECRGDWILYLQADELLHEDDHEEMRWLADNLDPSFAGVEFDRLYFWRDLSTLRKDWTLPMTRMFRNGAGRVTGDGMFCAVDGLTWPVMRDGIVPVPALYHYSRISDAETIAARIQNLDGLFHPADGIVRGGVYDWGLRTFDSYAAGTDPKPVSADVLVPFAGTHPKAALRWFGQ